MNSNPYLNQGKKSFWKTAIEEVSPLSLIDLYKKKWEIDIQTKISTAGSCFAQHINKYFKYYQLNAIDKEPPPNSLPKKYHSQYGYSMYSARYGNIYTAAQLLQLLDEAMGNFKPKNCK